MNKIIKAVIVVALWGALFGLFCGCSSNKPLIDNHPLDGPGMLNTAAPMLEMLNADWVSTDGRWTANIDGHTLKLFLEGDRVYEDSLYFTFDGENLNNKTELNLYYSEFESDDGSVSGVIEQFYTENCRLYMEIAYKDGTGENLVFEKAEEEIQVLDGDRTYVDNEPLLMALQGSWASEDGVWRLTIEDYTITILHEDAKVYCENYSFVFYGGADINEHTELELPDYELCRDGEERFASIEYLHSENGALYMEVSCEGCESESVTLKKLTE